MTFFGSYSLAEMLHNLLILHNDNESCWDYVHSILCDAYIQLRVRCFRIFLLKVHSFIYFLLR